MESEELFLHGLSTYKPACLRLTNVLMERIIRLLPTQADRYEVCLVHRVWTTAAMGILWESPQFASPSSVRYFLNTIRKNKQLALAVRKLDLVLSIADDHNDAFRESMRMTLERHGPYQDSPLAVPQVIQAVVQQCERLDALSIYGWQLEATHLRMIAAYLPHLQALRIIGSSCSQPVILPPLAAASLRQLHLYADFIVQPARFIQLESLRVSLHHDASFDKLCNLHSPFLKVRELMLANATQLTNGRLDALFTTFPHLAAFAVEDMTHPIDPARIVQSSHLKRLLIRATDDMAFLPQQENVPLSSAHLSTVQLDNLRSMNDHHFSRLVLHSDGLTSISLYNCPSLTDQAVIRICKENTPLQELEIVQCVQIGNNAVCALKNSLIVRTLHRLRIESSGPIQVGDIYELISSAASHLLEHVDIDGYPAIRDAFVGASSTAKRVVLDKTGIQSAVQLGIAPKERHLTSIQIVRLAKALDLSMQQLETLLDQVQLEEEDSVSVYPKTPHLNDNTKILINGHSSLVLEQSHDYPEEQATNEHISSLEKKQENTGYYSQQQSSQQQEQQQQQQQQHALQIQQQENQETEQQQSQQHVFQLHQQQQDRQILEIQNMHKRHLEFKRQQEQKRLESEEEEEQKRNQNLVQEQPPKRQEQQGHQQEEDQQQQVQESNLSQDDSDDTDETTETITISLSQEHQQDSDGYDDESICDIEEYENQEDLGGWGVTDDLSWLQNTEHSSGDSNSNESAQQVKHNYEHAWHQIARESPVVTAQKIQRASKTQPPLDNTEGWGTPKNVTEWSDVRLAYAHDVLETQKKTTFWSRSENGEWVELAYPTPSTPENAAATHPPVKVPLNYQRAYRSEPATGRPPSRGPGLPKRKPFGADAARRSSAGSSRFVSTRGTRLESANADKWAEFSANEMQQLKDAKKRLPVAQEVEQLEIPDLINLDSKDDDLLQLIPAISSPSLSADLSPIVPTSSKSTSQWIDFQ